jgi:hypothetical protein
MRNRSTSRNQILPQLRSKNEVNIPQFPHVWQELFSNVERIAPHSFCNIFIRISVMRSKK